MDELPMGKPISRTRAREIALQIMRDAETERFELAEKEAGRFMGDDDMDTPTSAHARKHYPKLVKALQLALGGAKVLVGTSDEPGRQRFLKIARKALRDAGEKLKCE